MKNKKAAMEMSVGTIVTIVLLMTVLVLGLILTQTIFKGGEDVTKLTLDKVKDEIGGIFQSGEVKVAVTSQSLELKNNQRGQFGIGIKNIADLTGASSNVFNYQIRFSENDCGINQDVSMRLINIGKSGTLEISPGDTAYDLIHFKIPKGFPECDIKYYLIVTRGSNNQPYDTIPLIVYVKN